MAKRGNQGWSTKGKEGSPGAGRPPSLRKRTRHSINAYAEEYALIKRFFNCLQYNMPLSKTILANLERMLGVKYKKPFDSSTHKSKGIE